MSNINETEINFDDIDTEELFQDSYEKAQDMIQDRGKAEKLLKRLERKLQNSSKLGKALAYIPKMGMLINSWLKGEYSEIPIGTLAAVIGVLIYFVSPIDAIPDFFPGIGLLDDAAVTSGALYLIKSDLDEYMNWRESEGLDEDFIIETECDLE